MYRLRCSQAVPRSLLRDEIADVRCAVGSSSGAGRSAAAAAAAASVGADDVLWPELVGRPEYSTK